MSNQNTTTATVNKLYDSCKENKVIKNYAEA